MNFKTTLVLLVLAAAGGALFWLGYTGGLRIAPPPPQHATGNTLQVLEELTPESLTRLKVHQGDREVVLERGADGVWSMPGKWPTRQPEVQELVQLLTGLRSRFAPIPVANPEGLKEYGLNEPAVTITVQAGEQEHRLALSEHEPPRPEDADETDAANRFSRPTYLHLDDNPEVVRLAPGLVASLEKPPDYYQQRRLFPVERVARDSDATPPPGMTAAPEGKVEQLAAQALTVEDHKNTDTNYTLSHTDSGWEVTQPVHDRPDPDRLRSILTAVPDIWAEQFVDKPKADLAEYGLKEPEQVLRVTRNGGATLTLLIGKLSPTVRERKTMRPNPPGTPPGLPPQEETVREEFRYAKLQDNDQVFEIKTDKLKDVFLPLDTIRDPRLARFRPEDATRLQVERPGEKPLLFAKKEGRWRIVEPLEADAESSKVTELLDKLSGLQARDKDVLDKAEPAKYGLDKPTTVTVTVEEEKKGESDKAEKKKTTRTLTLELGKQAPPGKLYVQVAGWPRVNVVEDSLTTLVQRPALAYRGRRVLDFARGDVDAIKVQRPGETVVLKQTEGAWKLAEPVSADADTSKASQLVGDLAALEAVEYVGEHVKPEDLETQYGLGKPTLSATVTFHEMTKPARTLLLGKQRPSKQEYYAKLEDGDSVFTVKKDIHDTLDQNSLAYRPLQFPTLPAEDVAELRVQKEGQDEYRLVQKEGSWKVAAPFEAPTLPGKVAPMVQDLTQLRAERYEAHTAKEPEKYGLDKPYLRLTLVMSPKKDAEGKETSQERVLLLGKVVEKEAPARFARLADAEGVFVVSAGLVTAEDVAALDLLDRRLLNVERDSIQRLHDQAGDAVLTLQRDKDGWIVKDSPAPPFPADPEAVETVLSAVSHLQAHRFAAYGPKAELEKYGLDKPATTLTVSVQKPTGEGKASETAEHTLDLGKPVEGEEGARYVRVDKGPGVAVLDAGTVRELTRGYLDYVNRTVLDFDPAAVTGLVRKMGDDTLEVVKREESWFLVKPAEYQADTGVMQDLLRLLTQKARRVAAYPAKDLKPFGLDEPAAVVTLRLSGPDDKTIERVLRIGKPAEENAGDRYAQAEGSQTVVVLPETLAKQLLDSPLAFRNRLLARFVDADRVVLERGPRKAVFAKVDGTWKMVEPIEADAEHIELENLVNAVARLRAAALVVEKPTEVQLKNYGLDHPEMHWLFQSGDDTVLSLFLGRREPNGGRCYARLEKGDLVFVLDAGLTSKLFAEYRNRTVWSPPLDSAQADALTYTRGGSTFKLVKGDAGWQVEGKPETQVKTEAVNDTLAAIAGLKAERFVVDKGADLKLYGVDPAAPELQIEVQTRNGKRVLYVGRPEGESKRYYAHVGDKDRSDVFIISEADAARIVRELPAFTQPTTKAAKPTP